MKDRFSTRALIDQKVAKKTHGMAQRDRLIAPPVLLDRQESIMVLVPGRFFFIYPLIQFLVPNFQFCFASFGYTSDDLEYR